MDAGLIANWLPLFAGVVWWAFRLWKEHSKASIKRVLREPAFDNEVCIRMDGESFVVCATIRLP